MRNLAQYPLTYDETLEALTHAMNEVSYRNTGLVGDMRPTIYAEIYGFLEKNKEAFEKHLTDRAIYR